MWPAIHRATRRLTERTAHPRTPVALAPAPVELPVEDVVIVLGRGEIALLLLALETELGDAVDVPNTPARLERALTLLMAGRGEPGRPRVLRRPAVLSVPESWEIHLDGIERATGQAVREAGRSGMFA
jgi:hypothetical protein